jgi:diguanylate cyclase (GGDEF)-like protein/PAS domain S-box-containing protein
MEGFIKNISKRRQVEQSLRECQASLQETQVIGCLGSYELDFATRIWTSSSMLDEILGINDGYLRNVDSWASLVHPDDRAMMLGYFAEEVVGKKKPFDKEYRILRQSDQAVLWVHGRGKLELDAQGRLSKMRGVIRDITQRKLADMHLLESEERFRSTFEQAPIGILHVGLETNILRCNIRFSEFLGYTPEELVGLTAQDLLAPEELESRLGALEKIASGAVASGSHESRYRSKNGSLVWANSTVSIQRDKEGRSQYFIVLVEDINARKHAEASLRETAERLTLAAQAGGVGIWDWDIEKNVLMWDEQMYRLYGITPDQFSGAYEAWQKGLHPDDRERGDEEIQAAQRGEQEFDIEFRVVWPDESIHYIRGHALVKRDAAGKAIRMVGTNWEITDQKRAEAKLLEATERLTLATRAGGVGIWDFDFLTQTMSWDDQMLCLYGMTREQFGGQYTDWENALHPEDKERAQEEANAAARGEGDFNTEFRVVWPDGSIHNVRGLAMVKRDAEGKAIRMIGTNWDITEQERAEAQLRESEERYRIAFQTSQDAINITRLSDGLYLEVNQAFLDLSGYERDEVIGRTADELGIWANSFDREKMVEILSAGGNFRLLEAQFRQKNGEVIWGQTSSSLMELDGLSCVFSIMRDITNAKKAEEEIRNLAFFDVLTTLPNRRLGTEQLRRALSASVRSNRKGALLFIDLDNFKRLNDTLGHTAGDQLLQEVARRLVTCVRSADTVARLGGDEFVVIIEDLSDSVEEAATHSSVVAGKILAAVNRSCFLANHECLFTCSIGVSVFGERTETAEMILQQADIAMYQAKAAGRNTVHYFASAMQTAITARASLEDDLRQAIAAEQFQLYYQPQVDSGVIVGVEALLRWRQPSRGMRPPMEFIPLAEETGLILPLGHWVLEMACRQIATWSKRKEVADLSIAVNVSARQLRQPDFVDQVLSLIYHTGATPHNLKLEITESMLVDNVEEVIAKMVMLKSHGVQFSMDDFGTGYSSLAYLKRFPLDQIKIDRAFVRDMLVDVTSGAIAQVIISLSKAMGIKVIAEGVETIAQRDFLVSLGCSAFQGYLISPPVPIEELELLLANPIEAGKASREFTGSNLEFAWPTESLP